MAESPEPPTPSPSVQRLSKLECAKRLIVPVRALINLVGITREDHRRREEIKLRSAGPNFV